MHKLGLGVLGVGAMFLMGGCPLAEVEADIDEACLTYSDLHVDAGDGDGQGAIHKQFVFDDLHALQELTGPGGDLQFFRVELSARSGISDFSFVDSARVTVGGGAPDTTLPTLTLVDCVNGACPTSGPEVDLTAQAKANALEYVRSGSILVGVDLSGELPQHGWSVDVHVCVKGTVRLSQGF